MCTCMWGKTKLHFEFASFAGQHWAPMMSMTASLCHANGSPISIPSLVHSSWDVSAQLIALWQGSWWEIIYSLIALAQQGALTLFYLDVLSLVIHLKAAFMWIRWLFLSFYGWMGCQFCHFAMQASFPPTSPQIQLVRTSTSLCLNIKLQHDLSLVWLTVLHAYFKTWRQVVCTFGSGSLLKS